MKFKKKPKRIKFRHSREYVKTMTDEFYKLMANATSETEKELLIKSYNITVKGSNYQC